VLINIHFLFYTGQITVV